MSKYLDYDGLSHFKDKLDDNLKTNINPVVSTTIDSKAVLTDETADVTSLATATVEQGDWVTSEGTDEEDYETASGSTQKYYYGDVTYTVTATLSEAQEADATVIIMVALRYMSGIDTDDDNELVHYYTNVTKNVTITIPAGETTGTATGSYRSLSHAGTVTVSVVSATTSAYTEQQTMTVKHLDGETDTYTFNGDGTILSGSTVVANDGGSYSEDLETLTIDGTGYNIPSGSSGSSNALYSHSMTFEVTSDDDTIGIFSLVLYSYREEKYTATDLPSIEFYPANGSILISNVSNYPIVAVTTNLGGSNGINNIFITWDGTIEDTGLDYTIISVGDIVYNVENFG